MVKMNTYAYEYIAELLSGTYKDEATQAIDSLYVRQYIKTAKQNKDAFIKKHTDKDLRKDITEVINLFSKTEEESVTNAFYGGMRYGARLIGALLNIGT